MKNWRNIAAGALLGIMMVPLVAGAQTSNNLRIGFVDVQRLLGESPQAEAATRTLQEEFAPRERDFVARENAFNDRRARILRDMEVMGAEERRNAEADLRKEERDLTRQREELVEDLNMRRNDALRRLQTELLTEVQGFAQRENFDLIVSDGVLYVSNTIDVTERVLGGLQERFRQSQQR